MSKPVEVSWVSWEMYDEKVGEFVKYLAVMEVPEDAQSRAQSTLELFGRFLLGRRQKAGE